MNPNIKIEKYSEKSFIVHGETKEIKDQLKANGGRYNPFLKLNDNPIKGWIFSNSRKKAVEDLLASVVVKVEQPTIEPVKVVAPPMPEAKVVTFKTDKPATPNWTLPSTTPPADLN